MGEWGEGDVSHCVSLTVTHSLTHFTSTALSFVLRAFVRSFVRLCLRSFVRSFVVRRPTTNERTIVTTNGRRQYRALSLCLALSLSNPRQLHWLCTSSEVAISWSSVCLCPINLHNPCSWTPHCCNCRSCDLQGAEMAPATNENVVCTWCPLSDSMRKIMQRFVSGVIRCGSASGAFANFIQCAQTTSGRRRWWQPCQT